MVLSKYCPEVTRSPDLKGVIKSGQDIPNTAKRIDNMELLRGSRKARMDNKQLQPALRRRLRSPGDQRKQGARTGSTATVSPSGQPISDPPSWVRTELE